MKHEETTTDELARMINAGFQSVTDEMRSGFKAVNERMDSMEGRMDSMEGRMDSMEGRMGSMEGRMGSMHREFQERFDVLEQKVSRIDRRQEQQMDAQYERMSVAEGDIKEIRKHIGLKPAKVSV
jgi:TolA-binding protein